MRAFQALLVIIFFTILGYTAITIGNHGFDLLSVFFGDMKAMGWPGQFNFDFFCMLMLSATWVGWRHQFSPPGIGLALLALFGGALFLSVYLLVASTKAQGDVRQLLLGPARAA